MQLFHSICIFLLINCPFRSQNSPERHPFMEMTRVCWNIPDSFSTSSLPLWITTVSIYQNALLWGQLPSTFITISMILCIPVSGECRCFGTHYFNAHRCNNLTAALFKNAIESVPIKWDSFSQFCFTSEANGGAVPVVTSRWRNFHELFYPPAPKPCPSSVCLSCPWWKEFLHKLHSTPQRENTCWRLLQRVGTETVDKQSSKTGLIFLFLDYFSQVSVLMSLRLCIRVYERESLCVKCECDCNCF